MKASNKIKSSAEEFVIMDVGRDVRCLLMGGRAHPWHMGTTLAATGQSINHFQTLIRIFPFSLSLGILKMNHKELFQLHLLCC